MIALLYESRYGQYGYLRISVENIESRLYLEPYVTTNAK
jgi:hypothetical protein